MKRNITAKKNSIIIKKLLASVLIVSMLLTPSLNSYKSVTASKLTWKHLVPWQQLILSGSNYIYMNIPRSYESTANSIRHQSGSLPFNSGKYGAERRVKPYLDSVNSPVDLDLIVWAQTNFLVSIYEKLTLAIVRPNGTYLYNGTIASSGMVTRNLRTKGWYEIRFASSKNYAWNTGYSVYDNTVGNGGGPVVPMPFGIELDNAKFQESFSFSNHFDYHVQDGQLLVLAERQSVIENSPSTINFDQLLRQNLDEETGLYISFFKDFHIGDSVIVEDALSDLVYDSIEDATKLYFISREDTPLIFNGDLTEKIKVNDVVKLKFSVVDDSSVEFEYATIDYVEKAKEGVDAWPSIEDFILR